MKKFSSFFLAAFSFIMLQRAQAQNSSPYWSLAGNSNATNESKLGTTNGVSLRFYAGNKQRMIIGYSTGNVGIGTGNAALTHRLTVKGNGRFTSGLVVDSGGLKVTNPLEGSIAIDAYVPGYGNGYAVRGITDAATGVYGHGMQGVWGNGEIGILGEGTYGVEGTNISNTSDADVGAGVTGYANYGIGVAAYSENSIGLSARTDNPDSYAGYFQGNVYTTGTYTSSDRTLKKNIVDFTSAIDIINKLQPKSYEFRQDGAYKLMNLPQGTHYGLIAQDLEQVLPTLVKNTKFNTKLSQPPTKPEPGKAPVATTQQPSETINFKAVNYTELIPIVIKGMQELNEKTKEIDDLKAQVAELRQMMLDLKTGNTTPLTLNSAYLEQNTPNPVNGTTTIRYHIPGAATSAMLILTNVKGQVVKTVTLNSRGAGSLNFNTANVASGNYNYSLVVDGKQADTKRLIVAR